MILNKCNFFSKCLKNHVDIQVLLPGFSDNDKLFADLDSIYNTGVKYPVLYLLHGALEDASAWIRHTRIEDYAEKHQLAVIMPSGQNSFYVDARSGPDYFQFITEELPRFVEQIFPVSSCSEDRYIAGLSMGGYGAARCALGKPGFYRAFAVLSGAVDPQKLEPMMCSMGFDFFRYDLIFGGTDQIPGSENDLYQLARTLKGEKNLPDAYIYCGLQDTNNHEMNLDFYQTLCSSGFRATFTDGCGLHDWTYWDKCIEDFLNKVHADIKINNANSKC